MQSTRIYIVTDGTETKLVEATSGAQAIRHVIKPTHSAKAATTKEVAKLMLSGIAVERASASPTEGLPLFDHATKASDEATNQGAN